MCKYFRKEDMKKWSFKIEEYEEYEDVMGSHITILSLLNANDFPIFSNI